MEGFVHIRVDDRLIHGQVATRWATGLKVNRIMIIDDAVAVNETEKSIEYYRKAQELCDSHDEFIRLYQIDKKDLIKQGANEVDLFILPDELI